ncbi:PREDICTED: uncharacterized protein LOC106345056 [Brassica oleracea var. oleracea]|uniref:uncharacterized protein LOC106345056 n=1 Tax=Brassica oleracea var. oleracea TaxID=109376 RepID=UPI0006A6BF4E|nr:PREDICTED: uncharacterized protein LOC106345056 [Brassica oleracea var. oleracea]
MDIIRRKELGELPSKSTLLKRLTHSRGSFSSPVYMDFSSHTSSSAVYKRVSAQRVSWWDIMDQSTVLKEFEQRSGLAISMQKTSFFASGMTEPELASIQASTGMTLGSLPFRYLGVPLNSRKLTLSNCEPLFQQVKSRFSSWPDSVWVQWFKEVILKGSVHNFWTTKPKQSFSWFVNKLLKLKDTIFPLVKLRIQNGESALFWFDNWTPFGSLSDHLSNSPSRLGIPPHATVSSLFRNGSWHLPPARIETQVQLQAYLMTITLTEDQDYYEWEINGQVSERFKTGELYAYLCAERADVQWSKAVWFSGGIPRHNFHTWLSVLDRIPTRDRLISWGIKVDANCLLCNSMPESRNHLFFSCSFSFQLWSKVASRLEIQPQRGWEDTLNQMTALHLQKSHRLLVLTAWQATAYWLWNERNARLHSNTFRSVDSIFKLLDRQLINKLQSFRELNPRRSSQMMQRWIRFA